MSGDISACLFEESGPVVRFTPKRRTILSSVQLTLSECTAATKGAAVFALWGLCTPSHLLLSSDGAYKDTPPVVLAALRVDMPDQPNKCIALSAPIARLELMAGSTLSLALVHTATPATAVRELLTTNTPARRGKRGRGRCSPAPTSGSCARVANTSDVAALPTFSSVTIRLGGISVGPPLRLMVSLCDWRPLLVRRWFECVVKKSTVVQPPPEKADEMGMTRPTDRPREWWRPTLGTVTEAVALSVDGKLVRWHSGAVSLAAEFVPYQRFYWPARAEKTVRVRRHPHRHADVVGEIPPGTIVEAIGQAVDAFHDEVYVLVCLPSAFPGGGELVADYALADVGGGDALCVWGWSKVAGRSGLPLLEEVAHNELAPVRAHTSQLQSLQRSPRLSRTRTELFETTPLPDRSLFCRTEGLAPVHIRANPSTRSSVVGTIDSNEVKEAVALVDVPSRSAHRAVSASSHSRDESTDILRFVQWRSGGYSLLSDDKNVFLVPEEVEVFDATAAAGDVSVPHSVSPMSGFALPSSTAPAVGGE